MKATKKTASQKSMISTPKRGSKSKAVQLQAFTQPHEAHTDLLINGIWGAVSNSLWFYKSFNTEEVSAYKALIAEHFYTGKNTERTFKELIERICLAKRYLARKRGRYISKPSDYLNIHYPKGLTGTLSWLEQVNVVRQEVPDYNKGISTLAKVTLAYLKNPDPKVFCRSRKQLVEQNQFDLLQIFHNTIIHLQFN